MKKTHRFNNKEVIDELKNSGFEVFICHKPVDSDERYSWVTHAVIKKGEAEFYGSALCSSKDQFHRRKGTKIAINRAIKMLTKDLSFVDRKNYGKLFGGGKSDFENIIYPSERIVSI